MPTTQRLAAAARIICARATRDAQAARRARDTAAAAIDTARAARRSAAAADAAAYAADARAAETAAEAADAQAAADKAEAADAQARAWDEAWTHYAGGPGCDDSDACYCCPLVPTFSICANCRVNTG